MAGLSASTMSVIAESIFESEDFRNLENHYINHIIRAGNTVQERQERWDTCAEEVRAAKVTVQQRVPNYWWRTAPKNRWEPMVVQRQDMDQLERIEVEKRKKIQSEKRRSRFQSCIGWDWDENTPAR